jgi:hypothetical protein
VVNNRFEGRETLAPEEDDTTAAMAKSMESLVLAASSITATTSATTAVLTTATISGSSDGRDVMPPPPPKLRNSRGVPPPSPRTAEHNEYLSVSADPQLFCRRFFASTAAKLNVFELAYTCNVEWCSHTFSVRAR